MEMWATTVRMRGEEYAIVLLSINVETHKQDTQISERNKSMLAVARSVKMECSNIICIIIVLLNVLL